MATPTGTINLERELVCFICTEILYQPLTLLDCLHSFCGACLKEWFSHQHRKASSSHSSSSSSNPYTCPTCRGTVKDAQQNAMVNTLLDMFLAANPGRARTGEEKQEMAQIYKPGDTILPKVESRRRERRTRRGGDTAEARERQMIEEARERSLRDLQNSQSAHQNALHPSSAARQDRSSRSGERGEVRERRRTDDRHGSRQRSQNNESDLPQDESTSNEQRRRESISVTAPVASPRHPEAVEARQRQQTVVHQASLTSLISSSESGSGSGNTEDINELAQEILAEGLPILEGINVEALSEIEQDALAERVVEAYRQRRRERNQRNNPSLENAPHATVATDSASHDSLQVDEGQRHRRSESGSRTRRAETMPSAAQENPPAERPRSARTLPVDTSHSLPPTSSVVLTHRRRASSQGQHGDGPRSAPRQLSPSRGSTNPRSRSAIDVTESAQSQGQTNATRPFNGNAGQRFTIESTSPPQGPEIQPTTEIGAVPISGVNNAAGTDSIAGPTTQASVSTASRQANPASSDARSTRSTVQNTAQTGRRASGLHAEPSTSCYRCHRADLQYEVHKHCDPCDVSLCLRCYRAGKGCKHWYGFGHAAMARFGSSQPTSHHQAELPHSLFMGRKYLRPAPHTIIRSKLAKDGTTTIALQTTSDPTTRLQEGCFCDRCGVFANSCFWSCDYCNYGEWGFCRECVNTHHCCTHPLLPSAHKAFAPAPSTTNAGLEKTTPVFSDLHSVSLKPPSLPSQPSSAASAASASAGPLPDFINLVITTSCDICHQAIPPSAHRFHCPFHDSSTSTNPESRGDYDICAPCYQTLVKTNSIKRDDGSAGWRKCPSGHRTIITTFQPDHEGGQRRVVLNDLVGGWKSIEEAMADWNAELDAGRRDLGSGNSDNGPSSPSLGSTDGTTTVSARRLTARARTSLSPADPTSPLSGNPSPYVSSSRFPPDGGMGLRGVSWWSYFPDDLDRGPTDLCFPSGAEIREIKIDDDYPDWCGGVYAGDRGLLPAAYLRM